MSSANMALLRRGCAPHSNDPVSLPLGVEDWLTWQDGPLYDGTGKVCPAISEADIPVMIGAFGACEFIK